MAIAQTAARGKKGKNTGEERRKQGGKLTGPGEHES